MSSFPAVNGSSLPWGRSLENTRLFGRNYLPTLSTNDKDGLKDKVAVITGASSGIGKAIAMELAHRGAKVVLAARTQKKLEGISALIRKSGGVALPVPTDVSDDEQCKKLIDQTLRSFGALDILVNNAGISMRANFTDVDLRVLEKLMNTNFWGSVYCTKFALPHLLEKGGTIVGISSICGITPLPGRSGYVASKHALDGFLETIRVENMVRGLHVLLVHPGFTSSNIRQLALDRDGMPQIHTPKNEGKLMSAERVAEEVAEGIIHRKKEITLTTEGRMITWLYRHVPMVAERIIYREMKQEKGAPF